jgi:hypothetical protein
MAAKIRTNKERKSDLAFHQIACMAEVARQVHPRILLELGPPKEAIPLVINIRTIREWFDLLDKYAVEQVATSRKRTA